MTLVIVDYGVGNLTSILNMFRRLSIDACCSGDPDRVRTATKLVLPGVGHFDACLNSFHSSGLRDIVQERADTNCPILGICVGAQMMTRGSEEGQQPGLGWVAADTVRFNLPETGLKVPHMGWTDLQIASPSPLWTDLPEEPRFYFAHSFHFRFDEPHQVTGVADHGYEFPCAFRKDNIFGVQFHPEKSHRFGMKLLQNFANL